MDDRSEIEENFRRAERIKRQYEFIIGLLLGVVVILVLQLLK